MISTPPAPPGPQPSAIRSGDPSAAPGGADQPGNGLLVGLIAVCVVIEVVLQLADAGLLGGELRRLRGLAYNYGGFWPGLLHDWQPNFPGQPAAMFLTYGLLHGGLLHLGVNMATLWSLGQEMLARIGRRGFVAIWLAAQCAGGLAYAGLSASPRPMVGASGALFGLAGALLACAWRSRRAEGESLRPVLYAGALLMLLNIGMAWLLGGTLAWQTHLGGFLGGVVAMLAIQSRQPREDV